MILNFMWRTFIYLVSIFLLNVVLCSYKIIYFINYVYMCFLLCRYMGTVAFVGNVHYAKGTFVGVVMDHIEDGKNNGMLCSFLCLIFLS